MTPRDQTILDMLRAGKTQAEIDLALAELDAPAPAPAPTPAKRQRRRIDPAFAGLDKARRQLAMSRIERFSSYADQRCAELRAEYYSPRSAGLARCGRGRLGR